jgi:hypothetical protein
LNKINNIQELWDSKVQKKMAKIRLGYYPGEVKYWWIKYIATGKTGQSSGN